MKSVPVIRSRPSFGEIKLPSRSDREALGSLIDNGGGSYLAGQERKFLLDNRLDAARNWAASQAERTGQLKSELRTLERRLEWTPATVPLSHKTQGRNWAALLPAAGVSLVGFLGMTVSTIVLAEYVLRSASDLFAGNPIGAVLFATMPSQAAVAIKLYEQRLASPTIRWRYATTLFAVGMLSLGAWMLAAALYFAPQSGGLAAQLLADRGDYGAGFALLLTTVLCDLSFSYTALAGAAQLWARGECLGAAPNAEYRFLLREKVRLVRVIAESERQQDDAEDYLSRAKAGRELTRCEAEADLARARELWTQRQTAAQSAAITKLLSESEN